MEVFQEILDDVTTRCKTTTSETGKKLLTKIRHTMSDAAATEKKFNKLVEALINEILPEFRKVGDELEEQDAEVVIRLKNWTCGLHIMVHKAESEFQDQANYL
jgi:hypothetical protein